MDIARRIYRSRSFKAAGAAAAGCYRNLILMRARDDTARFERASCLVLAPHPDDETLACGATIMRKRAQGTRVWVVIVTDGRNSHKSAKLSPAALVDLRMKEAEEACRILGVDPAALRFLGYPDGGLAAEDDRLTEDVARLVGEFRPDEVLVPSAIDGHPDHRALNAATRRALAGSGVAVELFEYPVWFWDPRSWVDFDAKPWRQALQAVYRPLATLARVRPRTVRIGPHLERKRAAIAAYRSQTVNITGEPGWATLDERFQRQFLKPQEIFFAVSGRPGGGP